MLTTTDNPFSPKTQYDNWKQWDEDNGYYTEQFIARLIDVDVELDDEIAMNEATVKAIEEILEHDVIGIYKLV